MTRVLVVDDSDTVRHFYRRTLETQGVAIDEARNGIEALEQVLSASYDLILVDVNMAKMDGYEFVRSLRSPPVEQTVPVFMISSENQDADRLAAYRAGANLYLVKPVKPEELLSLVRLGTGRAR